MVRATDRLPLSTLLVACLCGCGQSAPPDTATGKGDWWIAYTSNYGEKWEVSALNPVTGQRRNLTDHAATDYLMNAWDGRLLITSDREEEYTPGTWRYYHLNPNSGELTAFPTLPMWDSRMGRSPDGSQYVLTLYENEQRRIAIVDSDGQNVRYLTDPDYWSSEPSWSADGEFIVYLSRRGGATDVWRVRPDGSDLLQLTHDPANDDERGYGGEGPARFSPDSTQLAWMSWRDEVWQVCIMDADGSNQRCISEGGRPEWSPDGSQIAFQRDSGEGNYDICLINADGIGLLRLSDDPAFEGGPMWVRFAPESG